MKFKTPDEAVELVIMLDHLRSPEGASVTFHCENPDGVGDNNECVVVCDEFTGWDEKPFRGKTVIQALHSALRARDEFYGIDGSKSRGKP